MKYLRSIVFLSLLSILTAVTPDKTLYAQNPVQKRYSVESGIIEYTYTGIQTGTETVYFDRWGMREARYAKGELDQMGVKRPINRLALMDGEWVYTIDLNQKMGLKTRNPFLPSGNSPVPSESVRLNEEVMKRMGGIKIGSEEVAGKPCDIWDVKSVGTKSWVWQWIPLKNESQVPHMAMTMIATKVEEGAVPDEKFQLPSDIQILMPPENTVPEPSKK